MQKSSKKTNNFNRCKNCGFDIIENESIEIDCIYPLNREKTKWNAYCNPTMGGCGRVVYGKSMFDITEKWNNGETSEIIV